MAGINNLREKAKSIWLKGMEVVGNTAANIASNTRYKVDEVTLQNKRREIMNDLAVKTYSLWLKGIRLPEELQKMLNELRNLDDQLNDMRAAKYASSDKLPEKEDLTDPENPDSCGEEPDAAVNSIPSPVSNEINGLFDNTVSVGQMARKVNHSLDQMSDRIRRFPQSEETTEEAERQE